MNLKNVYDENNLNISEVQHIFENFSNVEFISTNDLPVDVANINGKLFSIPLGHDIVKSCLSTATSNKNINNIANHKIL